VIDGSIFDPLVKGAVKTVDPETGESLMLDLGSAGDLKLEQFISEKENRFKRIGLRPLWIMNRENFMDDLVNEFKKLSSARKK
jgi:hypothetical protein